MRWFISAFFLFYLTGFAGADEKSDAKKQEDEVKKLVEKLQGTWEPTGITYNGKDFLADGKGPPAMRLNFSLVTAEAAERGLEILGRQVRESCEANAA